MIRFAVLIAAAIPLLGFAAPAPALGLAQSMVDLHNRTRSELGVPPVTWDPVLAAQAQGWADHLVGLGRLVHSRGPDGENLAAGSGGIGPEDLASCGSMRR